MYKCNNGNKTTHYACYQIKKRTIFKTGGGCKFKQKLNLIKKGWGMGSKQSQRVQIEFKTKLQACKTHFSCVCLFGEC